MILALTYLRLFAITCLPRRKKPSRRLIFFCFVCLYSWKICLGSFITFMAAILPRTDNLVGNQRWAWAGLIGDVHPLNQEKRVYRIRFHVVQFYLRNNFGHLHSLLFYMTLIVFVCINNFFLNFLKFCQQLFTLWGLIKIRLP